MLDEGVITSDPILDQVAAISCGVFNGTPVLDLEYEEDSNAEADANFVLTGHGEIRKWAEGRGAEPTCVQGTENEDGTCLLRLDFAGYTGEDSLQPISWEQWFRVFDKRKLALIVEDRTAGGKPGQFQQARQPRNRRSETMISTVSNAAFPMQ